MTMYLGRAILRHLLWGLRLLTLLGVCVCVYVRVCVLGLRVRSGFVTTLGPTLARYDRRRRGAYRG